MSEWMYRAQILLEPEQHRLLADIAERENRSISELVCEILREYLADGQETIQVERQMKASERLQRIREAGTKRYGVYRGDLIAESRSEREADIERVWRGES
jgi:hypothetical protein